MKTVLLFGAVGLIAAESAIADPALPKATSSTARTEDRLVFVTGSHIPQRIQRRPIGSTTFSPIRIIDRHEINGAGRRTTAGAFVNEPAIQIVGH